MRHVVVGAGAIGGAVAGLSTLAGQAMSVVCRPGSAQDEALRSGPLRIWTPDGGRTVHLQVLTLSQVLPDDWVWLAVKLQHARPILDALPSGVQVISLQNGLLAEPWCQTRGLACLPTMVWVPATNLVPGEVELCGLDGPGRIDFAAGPAADISHALLVAAGFRSDVRPDLEPWLGTKFLTNLGGIVQALGQPRAHAEAAMEEAKVIMRAAGVPFLEMDAFLGGLGPLEVGLVRGKPRGGGSTWQSVQRGQSLETEFLNGHVVTMAHSMGMQAPINQALVQQAEALEAS